MAYDIEKDWITAAGLRAVVIVTRRAIGTKQHRCGYVAVPQGHALHGVDYDQQMDCIAQSDVAESTLGKKSPILAITATVGSDLEGEAVRRSPDILFDVHGGLTYAGGEGYPVQSDGLWWFGFDCAHHGDAPIEKDEFSSLCGGVTLSFEYVASECEYLAGQIVTQFPVTH